MRMKLSIEAILRVESLRDSPNNSAIAGTHLPNQSSPYRDKFCLRYMDLIPSRILVLEFHVTRRHNAYLVLVWAHILSVSPLPGPGVDSQPAPGPGHKHPLRCSGPLGISGGQIFFGSRGASTSLFSFFGPACQPHQLSGVAPALTGPLQSHL